MSRVESAIRRRLEGGRRALVAYLTAGYPDADSTRRLAIAAIDAGADLLELGIPFSDPIADGPTIQRSSAAALEAGMTPARALDLVAAIHAERPATPLVVMTYFNPVLSMGLPAFLDRFEAAGGSGLVFPDLSIETFERYRAACEARAGLEVVQLVALTSPEDRARRIVETARGFVYVVGVTGVTGARSALPPELEGAVRRLRTATSRPLLVGFGISTPALARSVAAYADGVVVGSAIVDRIAAALPGDPVGPVSSFVAELRRAIDGR